jgi:hypothetical protein
MPASALIMQMSGVYEDRYVRQDGRWWISAMRMRQSSFVANSADGAGVLKNMTMPGTSHSFDAQGDA